MSKSIAREDLTVERLREVLDYDPETGVFIWKFRPETSKVWNVRFAGKQAGTIHRSRSNSYRCIRLAGVTYKAHRLAWLYVNGVFPPNQIDHRDGDGLNNPVANLREAPGGINHTNAAIPRNNSSGVCGVHWSEDGRKWVAMVRKDRKKYRIGLFTNLADAEASVIAKRAELGFSPTHGMAREQRAQLGPEAVAA